MAPITAPVMGYPVEAPLPQDRVQVPPGAPQEPSVQVKKKPPIYKLPMALRCTTFRCIFVTQI